MFRSTQSQHLSVLELAVTIGALISLVVVIFMGRRSSTDIPEEYLLEKKDEMEAAAAPSAPQMSAVKAWIPYVLIVIFILGSSKLVPPVNQALGAIKSTFVFYAGEGEQSFASHGSTHTRLCGCSSHLALLIQKALVLVLNL